MVKAGNRVTFDENEKGENVSHMLHKRTGKTSPIRYNGIYEFDLWVKERQRYGKFGALATEEEEDTGKPCAMIFHRHA